MNMKEKYLTEHFQCSYKDKLECLETLNIILDFFRKEIINCTSSLLHIEDEIENNKYPILFRKGIMLVMCNEPLEFIKKIMYNYIITEDYKRKDFLKSMIITESIIALSQGFICGNISSDILLTDRYLSYFGLEFIKDCNYELHY